jgi:sugar (pentulose or hexulose) kinase
MSEKYLLGIDNGTTVTKAALFDLHGREVAIGSQEVGVSHPEPGWAEQSMSDLWQATVRAIRQCLNQSAVDPAAIVGISLSGHGGGVWLLDAEGQPVRDAIIWLDGRAKPYLDRWVADGRFAELYDAGGWTLFAGIGACTIFPWLMEHEPASLDRAKVNLTSKDWTKFCLTGEQSTDQTMASIAHLDTATGQYSERVMQLSGISQYHHLFPPIVPSWQIAGHVTAQAAQETGLTPGTPVASGAFDGTCSTLGAGCIEVGQAASIVGTAGVHGVVSATPDPDPERNYSVMCHSVPDRFVKNAMTMLAVGNLNWFEKQFCLAEKLEAEQSGVSIYQVIDKGVAEVPVGAGGVVYLPFLQGERAPFAKQEARGVFFGLGDWHSRKHLLRAVFEGVALSTRDSYVCMQKGQPLKETYLTGGGARSPVWSQILADCTGNAMKIPAGVELGAKGTAMNAGVAVGVFANHSAAKQQMVQIENVYQPDAQSTPKYEDLYQFYKDLIAAVWPSWERSWEMGIADW